jgi:hypothetical protein
MTADDAFASLTFIPFGRQSGVVEEMEVRKARDSRH